jgi:hypothetical protein
MVKAVQSCGLTVGQVVFDGDKLSVVISGDSGETPKPALDQPRSAEDCSNLAEYKAWRDRKRAGSRA